MIKKVILSLCIIIVISIILYFYLAPTKPVINLGDEYDAFVNEDVFKKYDIKLIRVKKDYDNEVYYYLQVNSECIVEIEGRKYQDLEPVKLDISDSFENKYLDIYIYDRNNQKIDDIKIYYSSNYLQLQYLSWNKFDQSKLYYIILGIALLIIICELLSSYFINKGLKNKSQETLNPWILFKKSPFPIKLGYLFGLLLYLVIPYIFIFIGILILLFIILIYVKGIIPKLKALGLTLLSITLGLIIFFSLYLTFVPEAQIDYGYQEPTIQLSDEGKKAYHKLIDNATYYHKEPVAYFENDDFGFITLRTYIEWEYTSSDNKISLNYLFRFYKKNNFQRKDYFVILRTENQIIREVKDDSYEIILDDMQESLMAIEVRKTSNNELVYCSEYFPMYSDIYSAPLEFYLGGQYMENSQKVMMLFLIFTHLSVISSVLLLYILRHQIFANIKPKYKLLFQKQKNKEEEQNEY